jgi:predicted naringenin-chalcone synthase
LEDIGIWAIHPGGRKILDVISARLQLPTTVLKHSYEVLKNYGNMSSATIFFVLKRIIEDDSLSGNLFGVAFGPGLTMETFLMDKR